MLEGVDVADRDESEECVALDDGHMANASFGHDLADVIDGVRRFARDHRAGHDVADVCDRGVALLGDDTCEDVALREDAERLARGGVGDNEAADALGVHEAGGVEGGGVGADRDDLCALAADETFDGGHRGPLRVKAAGGGAVARRGVFGPPRRGLCPRIERSAEVLPPPANAGHQKRTPETKDAKGRLAESAPGGRRGG